MTSSLQIGRFCAVKVRRAADAAARGCRTTGRSDCTQCHAATGLQLHRVVALPEWHERLTVRIAAHDLALAAHR